MTSETLSMQIPDKIHAEIKALCAEGDCFVGMGEFSDAYKNHMSALNLVPEPKGRVRSYNLDTCGNRQSLSSSPFRSGAT